MDNIPSNCLCKVKIPFLIQLKRSLSSIEIKLKYLLRRLKMDFNKDKHIPALLNYNYVTFIRARGELLLKYFENFDEEEGYNWTEYMKMKDEDFCNSLGCGLEELRQLQKALPFSYEYDQFQGILIDLAED